MGTCTKVIIINNNNEDDNNNSKNDNNASSCSLPWLYYLTIVHQRIFCH